MHNGILLGIRKIKVMLFAGKKDCQRPALTKMPLTRVEAWGAEKQ